MGKLIFILGGARSGKSRFAMQLAQENYRQVCYLATAQALDEEMQARIATHRMDRPAGWKTLEIPLRIATTIDEQLDGYDLVLLDCLTLLISNILLEECGDGDNPAVDQVKTAIDKEVTSILELIQHNPADWIVVSNEVGMGLVPPNPLGRLYRDVLGMINQRFMRDAQQAYFLVAGVPLSLCNPLPGNNLTFAQDKQEG